MRARLPARTRLRVSVLPAKASPSCVPAASTSPRAAPAAPAATTSPSSGCVRRWATPARLFARAANTVRFGGAKFGWFSRLNTSIRRSTRPASSEPAPRRALHERHVDRAEIRPPEIAAARVAERTGWRNDERGGIEPLIRPPDDGVAGVASRRVAGTVWTDAGTERRRPLRARAVRGEKHRQRLPRAHGGDTRQLPAAQDVRRPPVQSSAAVGICQVTLNTQLCLASKSDRPLVVVGDELRHGRRGAVGRVGEEGRAPASCPRRDENVYDDWNVRPSSPPAAQLDRSARRYQESPSLLFSSMVVHAGFTRGVPAGMNTVPSGSVVGRREVHVGAPQQVEPARAGVRRPFRRSRTAAPAAG